jgi:ABC-type glycerol-3-phosphate transport system substrate-binding protein
MKTLSIFFLLMILLTGCNFGQEDSETITLTLASYGNRNLPVIDVFNESQNQYYIELVDYSKDGSVSRSAARTRLNAELASGEGPDLLYLWNLQMDVAVYGPKGFLEDLYPYIDQDDTLTREDLVESLFQAYEVDGHLYGAISGFSVITMFGPNSVLEQMDDWNFQVLKDLAAENGGAQNLFSTPQSKMGFLESAFTLSLNDLVDLETNTAKFDESYYKDLLEFCDGLDESPDYASTPESPVLSLYVLNSFLELQYYESFYNDDITFIGFPTTTGNGHCFTNITDQFAINANSAHKDGAWEFIKLLLSEEYQDAMYGNTMGLGFPTNRNSLSRLAAISTGQVRPDDEDTTVIFQGAMPDYTYRAATEAEVAQMLDLIDQTGKISYAQSDMLDIVEEEALAFFSGDKSVEEVQTITQQRVSVYLAEQQ